MPEKGRKQEKKGYFRLVCPAPGMEKVRRGLPQALVRKGPNRAGEPCSKPDLLKMWQTCSLRNSRK